jgi:hypothetical protein
LPDGRIFGQITQNMPQKIVYSRKKLEAVKWQNLAKSGRKEAEKYFYNYLAVKPYNYSICNFLDFYQCLLMQKVSEKVVLDGIC